MYEVKEIDLTRLQAFMQYADEGWEQNLVEGVASRAHQRWIQLIGERLQTSRLAYRAGLQPPEVENRRVVIRLTGFAVQIEEGMDPYDMHSAILKGRPAVRVPFRHKGPTTGFASRGTPMGFQFIKSSGKDEALKIGKRVMRAAKKLGPKEYLKPGFAPMMAGKEKIHSTDVFAGLARIRSGTGKGAASTYMSWRTISESNRDGVHWMHPGIEAKHLLDVVVEDIKEIANSIADGLIEGVLFAKGGTT